MVILTHFVIQRRSSSMAHGDKSWSFTPFSSSRDNQVRWHTETNHDHLHPFCHPETIKSDGMQRQIMVIHTLSAIQRQSGLIARKDHYSRLHLSWRLNVYRSRLLKSPPSSTRGKRARWHAETIIVICTFVEDSTSIDQDYFSLSFSSTRDKRVRWHTETIIVICTLVKDSTSINRDYFSLPFVN